MNKNLPEYVGFKNAAAGRIHAGKSDRVGVLVVASAAGTLTLSQANALTAGVVKDLATDNLSYFKADGDSAFTVTRPAIGVVGNTYAIPGAGIFYIEVESSQLDSNGGFTHVVASGATGVTLYTAVDLRYGNANAATL